MIVDPRGGDVRMPKPFLHLGDVGLVVERIGGGRRPQSMRADLETQRRRIGPYQLVNPVWRDRTIELAGGVVLHRPEQRTIFIGAVPGGVEIIVDEAIGAGMQRHVARLAAFAGHFQMRHAFARMSEVADLQLAQFLAP